MIQKMQNKLLMFIMIFSFTSSSLYGENPCCCNQNSWISWAGGAILGAAAGAGAGYAASCAREHRGKRGRQGPTGQAGPSSTTGIIFPVSSDSSLIVTFDSTTMTNPTPPMVSFSLELIDPLGNIVGFQTNLDSQSGIVPLYNSPIGEEKVEGEYLLRWTIIDPLNNIMSIFTNLGRIIVQINDIPSILVTEDNELSSWLTGQQLLLSFNFP